MEMAELRRLTDSVEDFTPVRVVVDDVANGWQVELPLWAVDFRDDKVILEVNLWEWDV